jgi:uncharacterized membrane protein YgdD (TMEM256/DUF423 family)
MQKLFITSAAILGGLGVALGAFGAHALHDFLVKTDKLQVFETAVRYQFYHVFALLAVGILMYYSQSKLLTYSGYAFIGGIFLFSGSLYAMVATGISKLGMITPLGGLLFILGWILLAIGAYKSLSTPA